jgi:hypothetical protein
MQAGQEKKREEALEHAGKTLKQSLKIRKEAKATDPREQVAIGKAEALLEIKEKYGNRAFLDELQRLSPIDALRREVIGGMSMKPKNEEERLNREAFEDESGGAWEILEVMDDGTLYTRHKKTGVKAMYVRPKFGSGMGATGSFE